MDPAVQGGLDADHDCGVPEAEALERYDLIGVSTTGERPDSFREELEVLTLEIEEYRCLFQAQDTLTKLLAPASGEKGFETHLHPDSTAGNPPFTGWDNGYFEVYTLIPERPWLIHPSCSIVWDAMDDAIDALSSEVGGGSQDVYCYVDTGWDTNGETAVGDLYDQLDARVDYNFGTNWPEFYQRNEVISSWVGEMDVCGWGEAPGRLSMNLAWECSGREDLERDSLFLHEVGHNFGAEHYPSEFYVNTCTGEFSVMNYCWAEQGALVFDSDNQDLVTDQYWAFG